MLTTAKTKKTPNAHGSIAILITGANTAKKTRNIQRKIEVANEKCNLQTNSLSLQRWTRQLGTREFPQVSIESRLSRHRATKRRALGRSKSHRSEATSPAKTTLAKIGRVRHIAAQPITYGQPSSLSSWVDYVVKGAAGKAVLRSVGPTLIDGRSESPAIYNQ
jgi:hypothetical protein